MEQEREKGKEREEGGREKRKRTCERVCIIIHVNKPLICTSFVYVCVYYVLMRACNNNYKPAMFHVCIIKPCALF